MKKKKNTKISPSLFFFSFSLFFLSFSYHVLELRAHEPLDLMREQPCRDEREEDSDFEGVQGVGKEREEEQKKTNEHFDPVLIEREGEKIENERKTHRLLPTWTFGQTGIRQRPSGPSPGRRGGAFSGESLRGSAFFFFEGSTTTTTTTTREGGERERESFILLRCPSSFSPSVFLFFFSLHRRVVFFFLSKPPSFFSFSSAPSSKSHGGQRK